MRAVCLDSFSDHCIPITTTKEEGFYVELFLYGPSLGLGVKNLKDIQSKKKNIHENRKLFKGYIKICETAAPIRN